MKALTVIALALSAIVLVSQYAPVYADYKAGAAKAVQAAEFKAQRDAKALAMCKAGTGSSYIVQGVRCAN